MLSLNSISTAYGDREILHDVSLNLTPGMFAALVGPNGAGKSTLLTAASGIIPCTKGTITLNDNLMASMNRRDVARAIAFLPQRTQMIFPFSVIQVVIMGRHPHSGFSAVDSPTDIDISHHALNELGIEHLASRSFIELSGGEQQLVLLARALAQHAPLMLLDEPLAGLDLRHQLAILTLAKGYAAAGKAVLCSFHDLNMARNWCDLAIVLNEGRISATGHPKAVLIPDVLEPVFQVKVQLTTKEHLAFKG